MQLIFLTAQVVVSTVFPMFLFIAEVVASRGILRYDNSVKTTQIKGLFDYTRIQPLNVFEFGNVSPFMDVL